MKRTYHFIRWMICTLLLCAFVNTINADRIVYNYDASGNRTSSREIIFRGGNSQDNDSVPRRHDLSLCRITIYPNPTEGQLRVEITGSVSFDGASITIYNASGSVIYNDSELDTVNDIDLTLCPNGIYLLIIRIDGETSSWKIIKT